MKDDPAGPSDTRPRDEYPGTPRWVKAFALVFAILVVAFLLVTVVGTALGLHTPMGHGG